MLASRTPITDANIAAHEADVAARIASGRLSRQAMAERPYAGAIARDIVGEMADFMLETGTGTMDDLKLRFSSDQLTEKNLQAARDRANRCWVRRAA
jgi:hypothetical protein